MNAWHACCLQHISTTGCDAPPTAATLPASRPNGVDAKQHKLAKNLKQAAKKHAQVPKVAVKAKSSQGMLSQDETNFIWACASGDIEAVRMYLGKGVNKDAMDNVGGKGGQEEGEGCNTNGRRGIIGTELSGARMSVPFIHVGGS